MAHIENVLEGEGKERVHRRKSTTEETLLFETEREEISEQDVQSTDRFELQTEADTTIRDDSALQVGATVTYMGPSVTATGTFSYASNHSKEEATREARSYARDVTTRAASRIQERIREERFVRTVAEVEETNKHLLQNTDGNENIVGVYRWADKIYDAQVVNYGRRLLLEFIVPSRRASTSTRLRKVRRKGWSSSGLSRRWCSKAGRCDCSLRPTSLSRPIRSGSRSTASQT